jgi:hypothetical protein
MPEPPNYVHTITDLLEFTTRRFEFSLRARREIDSFFADYIAEGSERSLVLEQSRALAYLNAAEYSLMPYFTGMQQLLGGHIRVSDVHARLALLKGDCSLIIWTHAPSQDRVRLMSISDLTVFGGDASKLARATDIEALDQTLGVPQIREYVRYLSSVHTQSNWPPAIEVARSGAIELQGLLWSLKAAVVQHTTEEDFGSALAEADVSSRGRPEPA